MERRRVGARGGRCGGKSKAKAWPRLSYSCSDSGREGCDLASGAHVPSSIATTHVPPPRRDHRIRLPGVDQHYCVPANRILSNLKDVPKNDMGGFGREGLRSARTWFAQVSARTVVAREFAVRSKLAQHPRTFTYPRLTSRALIMLPGTLHCMPRLVCGIRAPQLKIGVQPELFPSYIFCTTYKTVMVRRGAPWCTCPVWPT